MGSLLTESQFFFSVSSTLGALRLQSVADLTIDTTRFENCAASQGAALAMTGSTLTLRSVFCGNNTAQTGGCLYSSATNVLTIVNSTFVDNVATGTSGAQTSAGGAVVMSPGTLTISTSVFQHNSAIQNGGAIRVRGLATISLSDTTFAENFALPGAGAFYATSGVISIVRCFFLRNSVRPAATENGLGSAVLIDSSNSLDLITVRDSIFDSNYAPPYPGIAPSGALTILTRPAVIDNCTFSNNSALVGAGLTLAQPKNVSITNSRFVDNNALAGAGMHFSNLGQIPAYSGLLVSGCQFLNNLINFKIPFNVIIGGAVYTEGGYSIVFERTLFDGNVVDASQPTSATVVAAAALHATPSLDGSLVVDMCSFRNNLAMSYDSNVGQGSAVRVQGFYNSRFVLKDSVFTYNKVVVSSYTQLAGGAVAAVVPLGYFGPLSVDIQRCSFDKNEAPTAGALVLIGATFAISDTTFTENAGRYNGALAGWADTRTGFSATGTVTNCTFRSNFGFSPEGIANFPDIVFGAIAVNSTDLRYFLNVTMMGPSVFTDGQVGGPILAAADVRVLAGASLKFSPVPPSSEGQVMRIPSIIAYNGAILDITAVTAQMVRLYLFGDSIATRPCYLLIGRYDATILPQAYSDTEVLVVAYDVSSLGGRLVLNGRVLDLASPFKTFRNLKILVQPDSYFFLYDSDIAMSNSTLEIAPNGTLWAPRYIGQSKLSGGVLDVRGNFYLSTIALVDVAVTMRPESTLQFWVTNFFTPSWIDLFGDGHIELNGTLLIRFEVAARPKPVYKQEFLIINSTAVSSASVTLKSSQGFTASFKTSSLTSPGLWIEVVNFFPTSASVASDGVTALVEFPLRTNAFAERDCSNVLSSSTRSTLSPTARCSWISDMVLSIKSTQLPSSELELLPGAIYAAHDPNMIAEWPAGLLLSPSETPVAPTLVVSYPHESPSCSDLYIDASASYNLGNPQRASFSWSDTSSSSSSLAAFFQTLPANSSTVTIAAALLPSNTSLNITFSLRNSMGRVASQLLSLKRSSAPVQSKIDGPEFRESYAHLGVVLRARAEVVSCFGNRSIDLIHSWAQISGPALSLLVTDQFILDIPGGSMTPGQLYIFEFAAGVAGAPPSRSQVSVAAVAGPLSVSVLGPSGLISNRTDVVLRAIIFDPNLLISSVSFQWNIEDCSGRNDDSDISSTAAANLFLNQERLLGSSNTTIVLPQSGVSCSRPDGTRFLLSQFTPTTNETLLIPAGLFAAGSVLFSVSVLDSDRNRAASALSYLNFTSQSISTVASIRIPSAESLKVLPQQKLSLQALFDGENAAPEDTIIHWRDASSSSLLSSSNLLTEPTGADIVVRPDAVIPGQFYAFTLELFSALTTPAILLTTARTYVIVNSAPSNGAVDAPGPISALRSTTISAPSWTDDDFPLRYLFSFRGNCLRNEIFLTDLLDVPTATVIFPCSGTLLVRVYDRQGASSTANTSISAVAPLANASVLLQEDFARYTKWGDLESASRISLALLAYEPSEKTSLRDNVLQLVAATISRRPLSFANTPTLISTLDLASQANLSSSGIQNCTYVLSQIISAAERASSSLLSSSSSAVSRTRASSLLSTAASIASALANSTSATREDKYQLISLVSRLVQIQARFLADGESPAQISTPSLNSSSSVTVNGSYSSLGISTAVVSANGTIGISSVSWAPGTFPFAFSPSSQVLQVLIENGQLDGSVEAEFEGTTGTCAQFDESSGRWNGTGCAKTLSSSGKTICSCISPQAASSASATRVSLSLLFGSFAPTPSALAPGPGATESTSPLALSTIEQSNVAGIVAGVVVAVVVVLVVIFLLVVAKVPSVRSKVAPFWKPKESATRAHTEADLELEEQAAPSLSAQQKWEDAVKPSTRK